MKYKVVLCLLLSVIVAYANDKEEKVNAAVSLKDMLTVFGMIKWCSKGPCTLKHSLCTTILKTLHHPLSTTKSIK